MSRIPWNFVVWVLGMVATFIFLALCAMALLNGCADTQKIIEYSRAGLTCEMKQAEAILVSWTCNEAQLRVDAVLATEPACVALDAGPYDVCAKYRERQARDGGIDGAH